MEKKTSSKLSDETIQGVIELGDTLRKIYTRLVAEGKVKLVKGKVIFID